MAKVERRKSSIELSPKRSSTTLAPTSILDDPFYNQFLGTEFDVNTHASQILQGVAVSEQLAKLAEGINALDRQIHLHVSEHYEDLLSQATGIEKLEGVLSMMQSHIQCLLSSVERLRTKIVEPYQKIQSQTSMLTRLQSACETLRRVIRVLYLSKRLQTQLKGGAAEITKAAQSINELEQLFKDNNLTGVEVIEEDQRTARERRIYIEKQAEQLMVQGLKGQNQIQIGTALQVFHNLECLRPTVFRILDSKREDIRYSVRDSLDVQLLAQSSSERMAKSGLTPGRVVMPGPGNSPQFRSLLWSSLEKLMEHILAVCIEVHQFQKVLSKKRDPITHLCFMENFSEDGNLMVTFWEGLGHVLTEEFEKAANETTFIRQAFEVEYPKFLRLYSELWKKLQSLNDDQVSTNSEEVLLVDIEQTQDTTALNAKLESSLRSSLAPFENAYLSRSLSRLFDPINLMFSSSDKKTIPTKEEMDLVIKTITSELTISVVDSMLNKLVAGNVVKTVKLFCGKCQQLVVSDGEASQVIGPATEGQVLNAGIMSLLYQFEQQLQLNINQINNLSPTVISTIESELKAIPAIMIDTINPLLASISEAIEAIILTMHKEDFSVPLRGNASDVNKPDAPCSLYMRELQGFITRVEADYLKLYRCGDFISERIHPVACNCLDLFVRHASLIRPLGEGGKMRLAADFAQMEMAVTPFCRRAGELGRPYRILRSFRPLLFQTPDHIAQASALGEIIPYSLVLHFLFARAPTELKSPHQTAGWSVSRYSNWLAEHSERERLTLVKGALEAYVLTVRQRHGKEFTSVYPIMLQLLQKGIDFNG